MSISREGDDVRKQSGWNKVRIFRELQVQGGRGICF